MIDSGFTKTIGLAVLTAVLATFTALANGGAAPAEASGVLATDTAAAAAATHHDSTVELRWLTDANILSLLSTIDARETALADAELQAWHSDTVRAFATDIARSAATTQHSADSLASSIRLAPIASALQDSMTAALQPHIDTVGMNHGPQMDRVFVQQSIGMHQIVSDNLAQLAGVAQSPEMQALMSSAQARIATQLARAKQIQAMFAVADSVAADSVARRAAARRSRRGGNQ